MRRNRVAATTLLLVLVASPAVAQSMAGMDMTRPMPAHKPAARKPAAKGSAGHAAAGHAAHTAPARRTTFETRTNGMAGMTMPDGGPPDTAMAQPTGTDLPPGQAAPPQPPTDHYADRAFPAAAMETARKRMMHEEGGQTLHQMMFNLAEFQIRNGHDGYRWDGEGWFGGDLRRLVVKSEGEGTLHRGIDAAEAQALYSRAIGPYFDLQAGVRHDFRPSRSRTYAAISIEGLAPYMFETEAALFLSTRGDLRARAEGWYDQRLTQRLIFQPRVELNFAAQDVRENRIGAGLANAELGLRLRYEISRQLAPYIGVSHDTKVGRTATLTRRDGEDVHTTSFVFGVRTWF